MRARISSKKLPAKKLPWESEQLMKSISMMRASSIDELLLLLSVFIFFVEASIVSKSSKQECIAENDVRNRNDTTCSSKLVVSLTVTADEVIFTANMWLIFNPISRGNHKIYMLASQE